MVEQRQFQVVLLMILVLQITAETTHSLSLIVRDGAEVTLPCENAINGHHNCARTTWSFSKQAKMAAVDLVDGGQVTERTNKKSDRLRVTANCSLVVKNATTEDVGRYFCIQEVNREKQAVVDVSVVTMTVEKDGDNMMVKCRLSTRNTCEHTMEWLYAARAVDEDNRDLNEQKLRCVVILTFKTSHFIYTSKNYELLTCKIKENNSYRSAQFTLNHQPSEVGKTPPGNIETPETEQKVPWWLYMVVPLGLAALLITAVVLIRQRRNKRKRTRTDENVAETEDGISYASISHTKKTDSTTKIRGGDDAVTYSMVKSSSAADHSSLYATIN
ncbi:uncharacterized protein LOC121521745 isoform X2 [Cheilinus undulatus]|uniref:uncharacterized protein LOC121521745 isoform X2 n=1 Tax=Cheilinus undulatus TaxID=241271 RepID=UPI001BD491FA|nr:uncharacterized protein LOC121521745 isoform X2 [Cheilinus undulatus]